MLNWWEVPGSLNHRPRCSVLRDFLRVPKHAILVNPSRRSLPHSIRIHNPSGRAQVAAKQLARPGYPVQLLLIQQQTFNQPAQPTSSCGALSSCFPYAVAWVWVRRRGFALTYSTIKRLDCAPSCLLRSIQTSNRLRREAFLQRLF